MCLAVQFYSYALGLLVLFVPAPLPRPITVYLGMDVTETPSGLTVNVVYLSSPAVEAGLLPGDEILTFDRVPVRNVADLTSFLKKKKPGDGITVAVRRQGKEQPILVKLGVRRSQGYLGATQANLRITTVKPDSPASKAGLQPQDIIVSIDGNKLETAQELVQVVSSRKAGEVLDVLVRRGDKDVKVQVKVGERPGY